MAGYLGKISAVIAANTQDFTRNIGTSKKELDAFQKKLNGIRLNLDTQSFDKTLTKLQLLQRTFQEARSLNIDVSNLERMSEVFEDVGKPLIDVKNDVEKLSNSVQSQLYPAMGMIQKTFQDMAHAARSGSSVSVESIDRVREALSELRASVAVVKDLESLSLKLLPETAGATFVQPHAKDELIRAGDLRGRAGKLSADIRAEPMWQAINAESGDVAAKITEAAAAVERYKLDLQEANRWMQEAKTAADQLAAAQLQADAAQNLANGQGDLDGYIARLRQINDLAERRVRLEEQTAKQQKMFVSASGGSGDKLDPILEGAASDFMTARQFRGNFGADNVMGRLNVTKAIQSAEDRINALIRQRHEIEQDSLMTNEQMAHALEANRRGIERETDALLRYTAAQSGGAFSEDQVLAAAKKRRKNTGSMGMGGFAGADLAFQQAMFAIDDFMSATGDMEYKLRAVSNNITQLGLMLGQSGLIKGLTATKGLFIGLAVVMGAELAIAIGKWAFNLDKAKEKTKTLNEALAEQKTRAEKVAQAYEALAKAIGSAGRSEDRRRALAREEQLAAAKNAATASRDAAIAASSPEIIAARMARSDSQKKLDESTQGFFETDQEFRARRARMAAGIASSLRVEERMTARRAASSISRKEATERLVGRDRRSGLYSESFDRAMGPGALGRLEDELAGVAMAAFAKGGRRDLSSGMMRQRDILDREREKVMERNDLSKADRESVLSFIDEELGKLGDALSRFTDLAAEDAAAIDGIARTLFQVGDEIERGSASMAHALSGRGAASRIQSEMNDLSEVIEMIQQMMADAVKNGEDPAAFKADAEAARNMAIRLAAAADNVARFASAISDATKTLDQDFGSFESRFSEARQASLLLDNPEAAARAGAARADMEAARKRKRDIEDAADNAMESMDGLLLWAGNPLSKRIAEINRQLAIPVDTVGEDGLNGGTAEERAAMRAERATLENSLRESFQNTREAKAVQASADEMSRQAIMAAASDRGRLLGLTPAQKAIEEMDAKIADIGARADVLKGDDKFAFVRQAQANLAKEVAPMIAGFREEALNAQLAGPSRQALNASDITTMQGQSELQRLLRGDDPNKDVNFVELQKQTELLRELPKRIAESTGIVLDIK